MANYTVNIPGQRVVVQMTTNTTIQMANLAFTNTAVENVYSASVKSIFWSGNTTVAREGVTLLNLSGEGDWDFAGRGVSIDLPSGNGASNIEVTTLGTCILELSKRSSLT